MSWNLIALFQRFPELLPLAVNTFMFGVAAWGGELGKSLYWLGAAVLTVGVLIMKG